MATYFGIVLCFLLAEARLETAFQVTRGQKDKFTNPECGENTDCTPSQCAQYFARCETKSCAVCICDEQNPTYVASEKRCVKDDDILSETGRLCLQYILQTKARFDECIANKVSKEAR